MTIQKNYLKETYVALIAAFAVGIVTNAIWGILVFIAIGIYVSRNDPIPEVNPMDNDEICSGIATNLSHIGYREEYRD